MIVAKIQIRVRYAETDRMGFAYHGNYLAWFEMARVKMMDDLGYPYREMEAAGFRMPVLEARIRYRQPSTFDDRLEVTAVMRGKATASLRIDYEVRKGETLIAEGHTRHAVIDANGRPVRPPPRFLKIIDQAFNTAGGMGMPNCNQT